MRLGLEPWVERWHWGPHSLPVLLVLLPMPPLVSKLELGLEPAHLLLLGRLSLAAVLLLAQESVKQSSAAVWWLHLAGRVQLCLARYQVQQR